MWYVRYKNWPMFVASIFLLLFLAGFAFFWPFYILRGSCWTRIKSGSMDRIRNLNVFSVHKSQMDGVWWISFWEWKTYRTNSSTPRNIKWNTDKLLLKKIPQVHQKQPLILSKISIALIWTQNDWYTANITCVKSTKNAMRWYFNMLIKTLLYDKIIDSLTSGFVWWQSQDKVMKQSIKTNVIIHQYQ